MEDLILLGASGLAREVIAARHRYRIVGILDDDEALHGLLIGGIEVLGGLGLAGELMARLVVCVGDGSGRRAIVHRLDGLGVSERRYATLMDGSVEIPNGCTVGNGSVILAGVVLTANVSIGHHVVIMPHCTLTHDTSIGDFATLAAGVTLGGAVRLGEGSYLGMNASIRQNVRIGPDATVGMSAAVLEDVPGGETWAGVPARPLEARTGTRIGRMLS